MATFMIITLLDHGYCMRKDELKSFICEDESRRLKMLISGRAMALGKRRAAPDHDHLARRPHMLSFLNKQRSTKR